MIKQLLWRILERQLPVITYKTKLEKYFLSKKKVSSISKDSNDGFKTTPCNSDTVAHISEDRLNTTINMDMLVNVTNALSHLFPNKTVYATFGNHDYYRKNQFPDVTNYIYNRTAEIWKDWIGDDQMNNFRKGRLPQKGFLPKRI